MSSAADAWQLLHECNKQLDGCRIESLFRAEPDRVDRRSIEIGGLYADFSRHCIDATAFDALIALAEQRELPGAIGALFDGATVNITEDRPALHTALRSSLGEDPVANAARAEAVQVLETMQRLARAVRDGERRGITGKRITTVLSIGIGGSDLGPRLAVDALGCDGLDVRFLANVDGHAVDRALADLDPETTLFCVISKSFTTRETLLNATTARQWLADRLGVAPQRAGAQFLGVTANPERAREFGLDSEAILPMWDWVGGRYSLWSAVGLPVALAIGPDGFAELLAGAAAMDQHFRHTPLADNLPVMLGLVGIWHRNIAGLPAYTVVPYDQRLALLGEYLQQLDMESNGKGVDAEGQPLQRASGPATWGGVGTNSQHAYFQWLHQGTDIVPVDFIGVVQPDHANAAHHAELLSNLVGQSWALMRGRDAEATRRDLGDAHISQRSFTGNRPSTTLLLDQLTPRTLGSLLALYEHKIYVQGRIWGINSFDQWGVELGKTLAKQVLPWLGGAPTSAQLDPSTARLVARLRNRSLSGQ